jgi:hypothetical protein
VRRRREDERRNSGGEDDVRTSDGGRLAADGWNGDVNSPNGGPIDARERRYTQPPRAYTPPPDTR